MGLSAGVLTPWARELAEGRTADWGPQAPGRKLWVSQPLLHTHEDLLSLLPGFVVPSVVWIPEVPLMSVGVHTPPSFAEP